MTHNETVNFLTIQGWDYDPNLPDGECFRPNDYLPAIDSKEWYTLQEALDIERMNDPEAFREFELLDNLDNRYLTMVSQYMDS